MPTETIHVERPVAAPEEVAAVIDQHVDGLLAGQPPGAADRPHQAVWDPQAQTLTVKYPDGLTVEVKLQVNSSLPPGHPVVLRPSMELVDGHWVQAGPAGVVLPAHLPTEVAARPELVHQELNHAWQTLHEQMQGFHGAPDAPRTPENLHALEQPAPDVRLIEADQVSFRTAAPVEQTPQPVTPESVRHNLTNPDVPPEVVAWTQEHLAVRTEDGSFVPKSAEEIDATIAQLRQEAIDAVSGGPEQISQELAPAPPETFAHGRNRTGAELPDQVHELVDKAKAHLLDKYPEHVVAQRLHDLDMVAAQADRVSELVAEAQRTGDIRELVQGVRELSKAVNEYSDRYAGWRDFGNGGELADPGWRDLHGVDPLESVEMATRVVSIDPTTHQLHVMDQAIAVAKIGDVLGPVFEEHALHTFERVVPKDMASVRALLPEELAGHLESWVNDPAARGGYRADIGVTFVSVEDAGQPRPISAIAATIVHEGMHALQPHSKLVFEAVQDGVNRGAISRADAEAILANLRFEREFEAFVVQQEFLRGLAGSGSPGYHSDQRLPRSDDYRALADRTPEELRQYVFDKYLSPAGQRAVGTDVLARFPELTAEHVVARAETAIASANHPIPSERQPGALQGPITARLAHEHGIDLGEIQHRQAEQAVPELNQQSHVDHQAGPSLLEERGTPPNPERPGPLGSAYRPGVHDAYATTKQGFDPNERATAELRASEGRHVTRLPTHPQSSHGYRSLEALERTGPEDPGRAVEYKDVGADTRSAVDSQLKRALTKFKPQPDGSRLAGDVVLDGRNGHLSLENAVNSVRSHMGRLLGAGDPRLAQIGRVETYLGDGSRVVYENGRITHHTPSGERVIGEWDATAGRFVAPPLTHTASPIPGTGFVPDGRPPHLWDVSQFELHEAAGRVLPEDFTGGAVRHIQSDGVFVRVHTADGQVHYFRPEVGRGMPNVAETTMGRGTPEHPHVVRVNNRVAGEQLARTWVHEISETLQHEAAARRAEPQGIGRRILGGLRRLFVAEARPEPQPQADPHIGARLDERRHLMRELAQTTEPGARARLWSEIEGIDRDLARLGQPTYHLPRPHPIWHPEVQHPPHFWRPEVQHGPGVIGAPEVQHGPGVIRGPEVQRGPAVHHTPEAQPTPEVQHTAEAQPVHEAAPEPASPPESTHDEIWTNRRWEQEGRRPSLDELIPSTDAEAAKWAETIKQEFAKLLDGKEFAGVRTRMDLEDPYAVTVYKNDVVVRMDLVDTETHSVGRVVRVFHRDYDGSIYVEHNTLHLPEGSQGKGFAAEWNRYLEDWYRYSGVDRIEVHASSTVGGYAWAKAGFDWAPNTEHRVNAILDRLRAEMRDIDADMEQIRAWANGDHTVDINRLRHKYHADDPVDMVADAMRQKDAAQDILNRAANNPFGRGDYPTPNDIARAGWNGEHGRDATWIGKRAMLGSDWKGVKPISEGGPLHSRRELYDSWGDIESELGPDPRPAQPMSTVEQLGGEPPGGPEETPRAPADRPTTPLHILAFDAAPGRSGQPGLMERVSTALGGIGDHVLLRQPDVPSTELAPRVQVSGAAPIPGVTGRLSPLLRLDGLPADADVIIGYGETAGIADVRRDAFPEAKIVQILDAVPTDPAHLAVIARADLVVAVGPEVAREVAAMLDSLGLERTPPVHELPPLDGETGGRGLHDIVIGLGDDVARVDHATWERELSPREVVLRRAGDTDVPTDEKLRVMTVSTEYWSNRGGVPTANRELTEAFGAAGAEVYARVSTVDFSNPELTHAQPTPGVHVIGVRHVWGVLDAKGEPDTRAMSMLPENLPPHVDVVVGHSRFSGGAAQWLVEHVYPDAKYIHVLHTSPEVLDALRGNPAEGLQHAQTERTLMRGADLVAGVGPLLGKEAARLSAEAAQVAPPVHEIISDMPAVAGDPPPRPPDRAGFEILVQGRAGDPIKGVDFAAELIAELRADGVDAHLTVRGAPDSAAAAIQARQLSEIAGNEVVVKPFTTNKAELLADLYQADLVMMPSMHEGFGLVASEAARAGVPVVVGEGTGAGLFFGDPHYVPAELGEPATVRDGVTVQALRDALAAVTAEDGTLTPEAIRSALERIGQQRLPAWAAHVKQVLEALDQHRQRALELREYLDRQFPPGSAARRLLEAMRGIETGGPSTPRAAAAQSSGPGAAGGSAAAPAQAASPDLVDPQLLRSALMPD